MITLWIVNRFEKKTLSTNLEQCFTASVTVHSTSIIVKAQNVLRTQARRRDLHELRYQLHSVVGRANVEPAPALAYMSPPPELQQFALNFLATFSGNLFSGYGGPSGDSVSNSTVPQLRELVIGLRLLDKAVNK